jgi:purine-binding chemotaxis protein CheW
VGEVNSENTQSVLIFSIRGQRYALPLEVVDRLTRSVAITTVADSPADLHGVVNIHGAVLPVINLRHRLGFPDRDVSLTDLFIVTHVSWGRLVMVVDEVQGLQEITEPDRTEKQRSISNTGAIEDVATLQDDIVLICNVERFLSGAGLEWAAGILGGKVE